MLDVELLDDAITARGQARLDTRSIRGLLESPHATALTIEQMDAAVAESFRARHAPAARRRGAAGR